MCQNGKTSLEGFETYVLVKEIHNGFLSEWKNIPGRVWNQKYLHCLLLVLRNVRMEKHPWKGLKLLPNPFSLPHQHSSQNGKTSLEGFETFGSDRWNHIFKKVRMEKHPWKGLKHRYNHLSAKRLISRQNGKTSLEGFETTRPELIWRTVWIRQNGKTSLEGFETTMYIIAPINIINTVRMEKHPWKGLKLLVCMIFAEQVFQGQNGKTSLEGFETIFVSSKDLIFRIVRMEKHPWKGLKLPNGTNPVRWHATGQNGKTSLEGFETWFINNV